jgi:hypothetical protein
MKTIPELPPAFALPQEYRQSLPAEVQEWIASVERRIDGLTLRRIEKEAEELRWIKVDPKGLEVAPKTFNGVE